MPQQFGEPVDEVAFRKPILENLRELDRRGWSVFACLSEESTQRVGEGEVLAFLGHDFLDENLRG